MCIEGVVANHARQNECFNNFFLIIVMYKKIKYVFHKKGFTYVKLTHEVFQQWRKHNKIMNGQS